jgi:hypothetical protein
VWQILSIARRIIMPADAHVRGLMAVAGDPSRQPWRELSVNEEIQDCWSTAWSAWRAA